MCWKNPLPPGFEKISADIMREKQMKMGTEKRTNVKKAKKGTEKYTIQRVKLIQKKGKE
jgi:hypothetical protein